MNTYNSIPEQYIPQKKPADYHIFSIIGYIIIFIASMFLVIYTPTFLFSVFSYRYPTANWHNVLTCILLTVSGILLLVLGIFLVRRHKRIRPNDHLKKVSRRTKSIIAVILSVILILVIIYSSLYIVLLVFFGDVFYSYTSDPDNYLEIDSNIYKNAEHITDGFFPSSIPDDAEEVTYIYEYNNLDFIVYAEWKLEKQDFENEIERIRNLYEDYYAERLGSFICLKRTYGSFLSTNYEIYAFAYDKETYTVRYICSDNYDFEENYSKIKW